MSTASSKPAAGAGPLRWLARLRHDPASAVSRRRGPASRSQRSAREGGQKFRAAAIDCGTNSLRLLVADVDPRARTLAEVDRRMEIVRLGQGVDATGRLAPEALDRTLAVLAGYAGIVGRGRCHRGADGGDQRHPGRGQRGRLRGRGARGAGIAPEVLSGEEEARLSFLGATLELAAEPGLARPPYLVADIGGGSTEFVLGDAARVTAAVSVDIGCVRLTERHLHGDPPAPAEIEAARADIDAALDVVAAKIPVATARTLVGLAGSVTTVAALALGLDGYDADRIHHSRLSARPRCGSRRPGLLAQPQAERARLAVMHPGRVDVIGGGALVLTAIMDRFGFGEVLVSEHDILDGIAWSLAGPVARMATPEAPAGPVPPGTGWPGDPATADHPGRP